MGSRLKSTNPRRDFPQTELRWPDGGSPLKVVYCGARSPTFSQCSQFVVVQHHDRTLFFCAFLKTNRRNIIMPYTNLPLSLLWFAVFYNKCVMNLLCML